MRDTCMGIGSNIFCDFRQAWKQLGDMEAEQAMQEYISCVNVLDPEGSTKVNGTGSASHSVTLRLTVQKSHLRCGIWPGVPTITC